MTEKKSALSRWTSTGAANQESAAKPVRSPRKASVARRSETTSKEAEDEKKQLLVYLKPAGIREMKKAVIDGEGASVSAIVAEAVNAWLQKHGRSPGA